MKNTDKNTDKITLTKEEREACNNLEHANARIHLEFFDPEDEGNYWMRDNDSTIDETVFANRLPMLKDKVANFIKVLKAYDELKSKLSSDDILLISSIFADFLTENYWLSALEDKIDDEEPYVDETMVIQSVSSFY